MEQKEHGSPGFPIPNPQSLTPAIAEALTDQQRRAIYARGVSVALSAGAGCGKTFVLTERFLSQLEPQGADRGGRPRLSQLVAITFTERAAREMRDRIRKACARRLEGCAENEVEYWVELLRELDTARISTIHSFCGSLLRSHAVEARLDPHFRVLDQSQAATLLYESLDQLIRDRLVQRDEATIDLIARFGLQRLYAMIATLLDARQEIEWPQWHSETAEALIARWADYWQNSTLPSVLGRIARSPAAQALLEIIRRYRCDHSTMQQRFELLSQRLPRLQESADPAGDLAAIREAAKMQGGGGKKAWPCEEAYAAFSTAAKELRDLIDRLTPVLAFDPLAARPAAETALRLLGLAEGVAEAYQQERDNLGVLDFDDLLIRAGKLLKTGEETAVALPRGTVPFSSDENRDSPPLTLTGPDSASLRKRLAAHVRLLLVDEFQDTDPLQAELVEALCDDGLLHGKLFFVGDYKQSIYRFRGAKPHVFRALRERMPPDGRLPLSLNFRSQPAVLDFVNALFCEEVGPDYEPLRPHRPQVAAVPAVEFLWAADDAEGETVAAEAADMPAAERLRRREADWIARRIRAMLDAGEKGEKLVWDEHAAKAGAPAARAVRPGDIALLFRALSNVEWYEEALRRYGIDYYLVGGHAFYAQQEIYDLLNLLRAIDDAGDEVSLVGALRSPFFSLYDESIFWLSRHPQGLAAGLLASELPEELTADQRRRVEFAAGTLTALRAMKDRLPIAQLIDAALDSTGYDAVLLAEFLGERKLANLKKLIEQARSFDHSGIFTLADFITQLSQFVAQQPDESLAATHGEKSDVVRLMTVHQSKGLEFPVVIVPDVDRMRRGPSTAAAFTRELGPMLRDPDAPSGFDLHMLAESEEEEAELVRLLYVATTRAADYLILSAGVQQVGSTKGPWTELLARRFDPLTGELRGTLPEGYSVPKITVTTSAPPLMSKPSTATPRHDLEKLLEKAQKTAHKGAGRVPQYLAAVPPDASARRQYSFSRLTGKLQPPQPIARIETPLSDALDEPAMDPRGLGTLVHAVLADVDFAEPGDIAALVRRHAWRHLPDAADGSDGLGEPIELIERFLASPRAAAIAAAQPVHRELEFLLAWNGGRESGVGGQRAGTVPIFVAGRQKNGTVPFDTPRVSPPSRYLQGFIDCLYQDAAQRWWLIDYKTNRVTAATAAAVAEGYEMQMLVYALAVERVLKCAPAGLVLCFLRPGLEHAFDWNDHARTRAVELIDQAMANAISEKSE